METVPFSDFDNDSISGIYQPAAVIAQRAGIFGGQSGILSFWTADIQFQTGTAGQKHHCS